MEVKDSKLLIAPRLCHLLGNGVSPGGRQGRISTGTTMKLISTAIIALLGVIHDAGAATFCVSDKTTLQEALTAAVASPEPDVIQLVETTFAVPPAGFSYPGPIDQARDLTLIGGFEPGCASRKSGHKTIIDASAATGNYALWIEANDSVVDISHLVIVSKPDNPSSSTNGGLRIQAQGSSVKLEANAFLLNNGDKGSALYVSAFQGSIELLDNIFAENNTSGDVVFIDIPLQCNIRNNTITRNHSTMGAAGLNLTCKDALVENNVVWGNDGFDLQLYGFSSSTSNNGFPGTYALASNDIEIAYVATSVVLQESDRANSDPKFIVGTFAFDPQPNSPIFNAGAADAALADNPTDYFERPRIADGRIDMGAIERVVTVFQNGFD
jgi:hypothetical protein